MVTTDDVTVVVVKLGDNGVPPATNGAAVPTF
jgi:hypothetical protein